MRNILKKTAFLIFTLASLFVMSCTEVAVEREEKSSAETGTLIFSGSDVARSVGPTFSADLAEFKKVTLIGKFGDEEEKPLGGWTSMAEFKSAKVDGVKIGSWVFTLKAETASDGTGAIYVGTKTVTVKGGTNSVEFNLSKTSNGTGNGTININLTVPATVKAAEVVIDGTTSNATLSGTTLTYSNATASAGQHRVTVKFYGDTERKLFLNSAIMVVNVVTGVASSWTETFSNVNEIYTITYNTNDGTISGTYPETYTVKSDAITLPTSVTKSGYLFKGWYGNAGYTGDKITSIPAGTTGNLTYYAKWEEYVAPKVTAWDFTSWSEETKANLAADSSWVQQPVSSSDSTLTDRYKKTLSDVAEANGVVIKELEGLFFNGSVTISWDSSKGKYIQTSATITIPVEANSKVTIKVANTGKDNQRKIKIVEGSTEKIYTPDKGTSQSTIEYTVGSGTESITLSCPDGMLNFFSIKGPVHATELELKVDGADSIAMKEGVSKTITATITPSDAVEKADPITWVSSDSSVIEVLEGVLVPKKVSSTTVTITATTSNGVEGTLTITGVAETRKPDSVSISCGGAKTIDKLAVGSTKQISATFTPADVEATALTWSSSNPSVVSVVNGVITGVSAGSNVTITATTVNGKFDSITITEVVDPSAVNDSIVFKDEGGWLEAAFAEWYPVGNSAVDGYNAYVKSTSASTWTKLDKELIRGYSNTVGGKTVDYYRVDALGLKAGSYQIKIVGKSGEEELSVEGISGNLSVMAHDRSGFGFSANSPLKTSSGAYNDDGTLRSGAQVIYITNDNAKTVTAEIGGTTYTGFQDIVYGKQKKDNSSVILDIRIVGTIYAANMDSFGSSAEGLQVKGANGYQNMNLTIEGVGKDAGIHGFGILIRNCGNVELRNFAVMDCMDDSISVDTDNCNLWIHNLDLYYGQAGGDADQKKGDGTIDIKLSQYCSVSYNHYWDSGKASLLDASEQSADKCVDYITMHHNWFDHSDSRHPRLRNGKRFHIYNNYYDGNAKYGVGSAVGASGFVENNYFRNCKYPMLISKQGSEAGAVLSGESGGILKSYGNTIVGGTFIPYSSNNTQFDAYDAATRDTVVPDSVKSTSNIGYSNFDTDSSIMYSYTPDTPEVARDKAIAYSGRIGGGDLRWIFDSSEDTNYAVIPAFKTAVVNYKTSLVTTNVEGGSTGGGNDPIDPPTPGTPTLTLDKSSLALNANGTGTIKATLTNSTDTISWSSDTSAVSLTPSSDGKTCTVTAGATAGSAKITATAGSLTATCNVTVNAGGGGNTGGGSSGTWTCPTGVSTTADGKLAINSDLTITTSNVMETKSVTATIGGTAVSNVLYTKSSISNTSTTIKFSAATGTSYSVTVYIALGDGSGSTTSGGSYTVGNGTPTTFSSAYAKETFTVVGGADVTVTYTIGGSKKRPMLGLVEYTKTN